MARPCRRALEFGDSEALAPGLAAFREAANMDIAPPAARIRAGRDGDRLAAPGSAVDEALSAFAAAVQVMKKRCGAGMRRADQLPSEDSCRIYAKLFFTA